MSEDAVKRFQRRKFNWLRASANRLPALAQGIVIRFALDHLNDTTHRAWIGVNTLADELGATRRSVQRALDRLVAGGWLDRQVTRGRGNSNRYTISSRFDDEKEGAATPVSDGKGVADDAYYDGKGVADDAISEHKRRRHEPEKASSRAVKGVAGDARVGKDSVSYSENVRRGVRAGEGPSVDEPTGRQVEPAAKRSRDQAEERKRKQKTPFPEGWQCGPAEEEAAAEIATWDAERVRKEEFGKFEDWAIREDVRSRDWLNVWRGWCKTGLEIDQREGEQRARRQNGSGSRRSNGRTEPTGLAYLERQAARQQRQAKGD